MHQQPQTAPIPEPETSAGDRRAGCVRVYSVVRANYALKTPVKVTESKSWFLKYKKLPGMYFTASNSARRVQLIPGHRRMGSQDITTAPGWRVVGYTLDAPFNPKNYDSVAIMFESDEGERIWHHFLACDNA